MLKKEYLSHSFFRHSMDIVLIGKIYIFVVRYKMTFGRLTITTKKNTSQGMSIYFLRDCVGISISN
jgi:hypothetical protein